MSASWNFARRPFRDDRPVWAITAALFLVGAVLLFVNVRLYAVYRHGVSDVTTEISALEARQRAAEAKANAARNALASYRLSALAEESRELSRIVAERRFSWTGLLARLERTLPSDVGIQRLQPHFDKDGTVSLDLQLVGRSREAVVPTIAALSHDSGFGEIRLLSEAQPEGNTAEPFQFAVTSRYLPDAKAEAASKTKTVTEKKSPDRKPAEKTPSARKPPAKNPATGQRRPEVRR